MLLHHAKTFDRLRNVRGKITLAVECRSSAMATGKQRQPGVNLHKEEREGGTDRSLLALGAGRHTMAETWTVRRMKTVRPMMRWSCSSFVPFGRPKTTPTAAPATPARYARACIHSRGRLAFFSAMWKT